MAERKDGEKAGGGVPAAPIGTSGDLQANPEGNLKTGSELPAVESPPLSPAADIPAAASSIEPTPAEVRSEAEAEPAEGAASAAPRAVARFRLRLRHKRRALLAASVAMGLFAGAGYGAIFSGSFAAKPRTDVAAIEERKAMLEQLAQLSKQVAGLKADLDRANKSTDSKIAKIAGRLQSATAPAPAAAPEITGSIPQSKSLADVPLPRPAPYIAAPLSRPVVVTGWSIRDTVGGYVYVQGQGEVFQVVPGAPLPGLGPVQAVKRENGRWVVVTPKGIIVSLRDRRHFE